MHNRGTSQSARPICAPVRALSFVACLNVGNRSRQRQLSPSYGHIAGYAFGSNVPAAELCSAAKVPHSITSSARTRIAGEIVTPMASAVFILRTNSNFVGCSTGRSATFAPFAIVSTNSAARRYMAGKITP